MLWALFLFWSFQRTWHWDRGIQSIRQRVFLRRSQTGQGTARRRFLQGELSMIYLRTIIGQFSYCSWFIHSLKSWFNPVFLSESTKVSAREPGEERTHIWACQWDGRKERMHVIAARTSLGSPSGNRCLSHSWNHKDQQLQPEPGSVVGEAHARGDGRAWVLCRHGWCPRWPVSQHISEYLEGFRDPSSVILERKLEMCTVIWVHSL